LIAVGKNTPTTSKSTSLPATVVPETTSDTSPTTQTTQPSSTKHRPNKTTLLLELMMTTQALPHPTIAPYSNDTSKASEHNGSGEYSNFVTNMTNETTSGLKISGGKVNIR